MKGILSIVAAIQIGKEEYPPIPKITFGFNFIKKNIEYEIA
mgnify:CR=1